MPPVLPLEDNCPGLGMRIGLTSRKRARAAAGAEFQQMETEFRRTLAAASAPPARDASP